MEDHKNSEVNIKNDKNGVCPEDVLTPTLHKAVKDIIKREGYVTHVLNARSLPQDGANYMTKLVVANIKGKTAEGDKVTDIFVKEILPDDENGFFLASEFHSMELFVYREPLRYYKKLQEEAGIPIEDRYNITKFYEESNSQFIILENLVSQGYTSVNRMDPITLNFAEQSVKQLAKFHSLAFVLKNKHPDYFDKKIRSLEFKVDFGDKWKTFIKNIFSASTQELSSDIRKKTDAFLPIFLERFPQYYQDKSVECLCHGDYRANNILLKNDDGKITKIIPVDYQAIRYGNPITDLIYFIFLGTDQQFRKDHLENIKNLYHDTMARFLKYFDMDVEDYFPRAQFEKEFAAKLDFGFMTATWLLPFVFAAEDDLPEINGAVDKVDYNVDKRMKYRLEGIVDDFIKWGYL
ncbi:uncharacterized protein LOC131851564 [Achroia grisella]|uniref:uncharacterized protein LOC131851564 n=1 Tax=Achroia grisella TaxID=688607 RepID=UPI0027D28093|nr:uncharacterized protein LOC131851564 [Achroia grisella]